MRWVVLDSADLPDSLHDRHLVLVGGVRAGPAGSLISRLRSGESGRMAPREARGSVWGRSPWNADRVVAVASGSSRVGIRDAADSVMNAVLEASGSRDDWFVPVMDVSPARAEEQIRSWLHRPGDDVVPIEALRLTSSRGTGIGLGAAQAAEDVERLFHLLSHGWCGYGYFRDRGDFAEAKRRILVDVGRAAGWSSASLAEVIARHLRFVHDFHLNVGDRRFGQHIHFWYDVRFALYPEGAGYGFERNGVRHTILSVNGRPPREHVFPSLDARGDPVYRLGALSRTEPSPLVLTTSDGRAQRRWTVRLRRSQPQDLPRWAAVVGEESVGGVPVLRVRSFRDQHATELTRLVESAARYRGLPYLILDLRGNSGGNDAWPWRWIEGFTGREPFPKVVSTSLITRVTMMGLVNCRTEEAASVPDGVRERFRRDIAAFEASADSLERGLTQPRWTPLRFPVARRIPNPTTLVVLTDGNVASAAEGLLSYVFRQVDNVVVVGENSTGAVTFGQTSVHRLPHSGLRVVLPIQLMIRSDLRWTEERGFDPDLWVPAGEALNCAVAAIRKGTIPTVGRLPDGYFAAAFVPERPPWSRWLSGRRSTDLLGAGVLLVVGAALLWFLRVRPAFLAAYGVVVLTTGVVVAPRGVLAGFWLIGYGLAFGAIGVSRLRAARATGRSA